MKLILSLGLSIFLTTTVTYGDVSTYDFKTGNTVKDVDWGRYCTLQIYQDSLECSSRVTYNSPSSTHCWHNIEIKNINSGLPISLKIQSFKSAEGGMGVFNMLGLGLLIDGPRAFSSAYGAQRRAFLKMKIAAEHACPDTRVTEDQIDSIALAVQEGTHLQSNDTLSDGR